MKKPVSVLVVIHTPALEVLLLERAAQRGFWQSVTGSQEDGESLIETARREVQEETGIHVSTSEIVDWRLCNRFEIFPIWRHRYGPNVTHNDEHVFSLQLAERVDIRLAPDEHVAFQWLPWKQAVEQCFSWTNRDALCILPLRHGESVAIKKMPGRP